MRIGSLFSGIGGLELGLESAGVGYVVWQVEHDPFCQEVLEHHWPEARIHVDVTKVGAHCLEAVDVICGGFPCQDISLAGTGEGIAGRRSGLWAEYRRIVGEIRPRYVVVENVAALRRRGLGEVLGDLASLGYDAWRDCVPAAAVGAPHRRDRLFVVAWRVSDAERDRLRYEPERGSGAACQSDGGPAVALHVGEELGGPGAERLKEGEAEEFSRGREGRLAPAERASGVVAYADGGRPQGLGFQDRQPRQRRPPGDVSDGPSRPQWPPAPDDLQAWGRVPADSQPAVCRVADGIPDRLDSLGALGNTVVPAVAEVIGHALLHLHFRLTGESLDPNP